MKALFISGIDFESQIQIGDHHLARQFMQNGWDVAFLSTPVTPFHNFSKNNTNIARRIRNHTLGGYSYNHNMGTLWSYVPAGLIFPRNIFGLNNTFLYQHWIDFTYPNIKKILARKGFDNVDLLYIRDSTQSVYRHIISNKFTVFRIADNDAGFNNYNKAVQKNQIWLANKSDLLVYSASSLKSIVSNLNPRNSIFLPNGVDYQHFSHGSREIPKALSDIPGPKVIYIGSIDYWFDFSLVNYLADTLKNLSFIIIGECEKFKEKFGERANIHLLGPIPYKDIPPYLWNSTLGIIPFNIKDFPDLVNYINPIKLYEYMACGLPVVATHWDELQELKSPAYLCKSNSEFVENIKKCINENANITNLQNYAFRNDWHNRYRLLFDAINSIHKTIF